MTGFDLRALEAWANQEPVVRLIIGPDQALHWANNAAQAFLAAQRAVGIAQGKLVFSHEANRTSFRALIAKAATGPAAAILDCDAPLGRIVATAAVLPMDGAALLGVTLRTPRAATIQTTLLQSAFGLTKTECEVIGLLLQGLMAEEAARRMRITVVTTRTHIRNLYTKLNVSSREALFSRLLPYLDIG